MVGSVITIVSDVPTNPCRFVSLSGDSMVSSDTSMGESILAFLSFMALVTCLINELINNSKTSEYMRHVMQ